MLLNANAVLFAVTMDFRILVLLGRRWCFSRLRWLSTAISTGMPPGSLVNNMCMLLAIGFIILTRLNFEQAVRQFIIAAAAVVITCFIPVLVAKLKVSTSLPGSTPWWDWPAWRWWLWREVPTTAPS